MGYTLFYVACGENGERPEVVAEVGVNEHCPCHAADGEVCAFGDTVLRWGVGYCLFICDAVGFAKFFHLSVDKFGSVVDSEKRYFLSAEVFSGVFELGEQGDSFVPGLHQK